VIDAAEIQSTLTRLATRLTDDYGAKARPGADIHFFEIPMYHHPDGSYHDQKQLEAYALDSAYAALATKDLLVAFRAYVQLKEYVSKLGGGWIARVTETADYYAKLRIEDSLKSVSVKAA